MAEGREVADLEVGILKDNVHSMCPHFLHYPRY
jgi:hypothetical protein